MDEADGGEQGNERHKGSMVDEDIRYERLSEQVE